MRPLPLVVMPGTYAVCRLGAGCAVPPWAEAGAFVSVTRTADELSVVCPQEAVPTGVRQEGGWRCLRVAGTLDFAAVGVLAGLTTAPAAAGVSVFAVSTFDTDYLLVRVTDLGPAVAALIGSGHDVTFAAPGGAG